MPKLTFAPKYAEGDLVSYVTDDFHIPFVVTGYEIKGGHIGYYIDRIGTEGMVALASEIELHLPSRRKEVPLLDTI